MEFSQRESIPNSDCAQASVRAQQAQPAALSLSESKPSDGTAIFKGFVFLAVFLVLEGWGLSAVKLLQWQWVGAVFGLGVAVWMARRAAGSWQGLWREAANPLDYWPIWLLAGVLLFAALVYPPAMHDSLTYRLPRLLFWNHDGYIHYLDTADERLNFFPPVWELCTLPLVQLSGLKFCWLWNYVSWLICLMIFYRWGVEFTGSRRKAQQLSFLAGTSTFALLQAYHSGTDLLATTFLLLSLYFIGNFEKTRQPGLIYWSISAVVLAAGTKPHFTVLCLPLVLWFWFSPSRPWRVFRWRWLGLALPVWLICSPLLTFLSNTQHYGNWKGPASDKTYMGTGPGWNALLGAPMLAWQAFQPSVNPLAFALNKPLENWIEKSGIREIAPRFNLKMVPINMVDNASLGFVTTVLVVIGAWLACRKNRVLCKQWPGWGAAAGILSFLLAVSQYLPLAVGRSFAGFAFLVFPLALGGWALFSAGLLRFTVVVALATSLLLLVVNPAKPLWPVQTAGKFLEARGYTGLVDKLNTYGSVRQRTYAGRELLECIPPDQKLLAAAIAEGRPILPVIWQRHDLEVILLDDGATVEDLRATQARYLLVSGGGEESYPELCKFLQSTNEFVLVKSVVCVSKLAVGPETWKLYCRR